MHGILPGKETERENTATFASSEAKLPLLRPVNLFLPQHRGFQSCAQCPVRVFGVCSSTGKICSNTTLRTLGRLEYSFLWLPFNSFIWSGLPPFLLLLFLLLHDTGG
jgi:hypothetical protein